MASAASTSTKVRSPNYPVLSLGEAITRAQTVFERENTHPADREVIARSLGYGGLNGASLGVISALIKYGLLEQDGDQLRVRPAALDILVHQTGEPERVAAIQKAAFTPALFSELYDLYGDRLPSDHSLRAYLVKKGFNPKTVDGVIRSYRDTISFLENEAGQSSAESDDIPDHEDAMTQTPPAPERQAPTFKAPPADVPPPARDPNAKSFLYGLSPGVDAEVTLRGPFTIEDLELLRDYIELQERGMRRALEREQAQHQITDYVVPIYRSSAPPQEPGLVPYTRESDEPS